MNELQELENLLQGLLRTVQEVLMSGEILSDEFQGELANTLQRLTQRIETLRTPTGTPITPSEIQPAMPSSNVEGFAYDPRSQRLYVRFLGNHPNRFGPIYQYEGVPNNIFDIFRKGAIPAKTNGRNKWGRWWRGKYPSIGAAMYHLIRAGNYPYQRVS